VIQNRKDIKQVTPEKLLYAKTHEWVSVDTAGATPAGGRVATIGISAFAVEALTDLVYIELPAVGRQVKQGESFGEIESVKAVSDLYSPVDGEILEVNSALVGHLETLNVDPYGKGWIAKIRLSDETSLKQLLDYPAYQKQCAEEGH
jgi:glycine cleavage system H protein